MSENNKYVVTSRYDRERRNKSNFIREHILVAEKKLGRKLNKGETVHHIDLNKSNNDPSNLIIFATNADHSAYHKGCEIYEKDGIWYAKHKTGTCLVCGKTFELSDNNHTYCSRECAAKAQRKYNVSKQELEKVLKEQNGNFSKLGRMYGVSDNAIRKRCKLYGLSTHSSDYKSGN